MMISRLEPAGGVWAQLGMLIAEDLLNAGDMNGVEAHVVQA